MMYSLTQRSLYIYIVFIVLISQNIFAQEKDFIIPDSLKEKDYDYLIEKAQNNSNDTILSLTYINTYLAKAIDEENSYRKLNGHIFLSYYSNSKGFKLKHIKKAVSETKNVDEKDLISSYIYFGAVYHEYFDYEKAIDYYIKGLKISEKYDNKDAEYIILNNIAKIKTNIGKHDKALDLYKKCHIYEINKGDSINIRTIINIAESMRNNKKYDSASYYYNIINEKAYRENPTYGDIASINEGINLYYKKEYLEAERLLKKGSFNKKITIENQNEYILSQLYLGKIQVILYDNDENAKEYFTKVDSLISHKNIIIPNTIEAYEFLINYYEDRGDLKKQLDMINKLYDIRTTLSKRKINIIDRLYSEFDIPQLLKSKEKIIQKLKQETTTLNIRTTYLIIFVFLLIIVSIFQYNKHKIYKKRFDKIILQLDNKEIKKSNISSNTNTQNVLLKEIDQTTIDSILQKLDKFEEKNGFLQKDITLFLLAKQCTTNTKYLPKVISAYKHKSFVNYINNLRVDYILKALKENPTLQKYTIKTISEEAGFNTAESFARAFKNKTGIRPSYYIRNLKKKGEN